MYRLPSIGVTAWPKQVGLHAYHISGDSYVRAVTSAARDLPLIMRSQADVFGPAIIFDGLAVTSVIGLPSRLQSKSAHRAVPIRGVARDSARLLLEECNVSANGR